MHLQIATWNVNSLTIRLPQVLSWLATHPVDVLALQELKLTEDKFPYEAFASIGYHAQVLGQKTYNGVALVSRQPLTHPVFNMPDFDDASARVITGTFTPETLTSAIRIVGAYFPNGQAPNSDKFAYKIRWLSHLRTWLVQELLRYPQLILLGDFNITFDDHDVWDSEGMRDQIHCTHEEREHLNALIDLGLIDSLRLGTNNPRSTFSWWDYRNFAFRRNHGMRIDHILISHALKPCFSSCCVDKLPRKNERPSDHAPVILTLDLPTSSK